LQKKEVPYPSWHDYDYQLNLTTFAFEANACVVQSGCFFNCNLNMTNLRPNGMLISIEPTKNNWQVPREEVGGNAFPQFFHSNLT